MADPNRQQYQQYAPAHPPAHQQPFSTQGPSHPPPHQQALSGQGPPAAVYQLPPLPQAAAVLPNWIARQTTTLILKEKIMSWSGDDLYVNDINGVPVFRIAGKVMSISARMELSDAAGNHLFTIRKEPISLLTRFYAEGPSGERFLEVRGKLSFGSRRFEISFVDSVTNQKVEMKMKENIFDTAAEITMPDGQVVVKVDRKILNARDLIMGKNTYAVTVAPGMDLACAIAMCIALDEARQHK